MTKNPPKTSFATVVAEPKPTVSGFAPKDYNLDTREDKYDMRGNLINPRETVVRSGPDFTPKK